VTYNAISRLEAERIHCFGGVGRTGTAVCCWLLRHGLAAPQDVITTLQELRQADHQTKGRKAPETSEQIAFVEGWLGIDG